MYDWATNLIEQTGYLGIFVGMVLDNIFPPIPSEPLMMFAGAAASKGDTLNIFLVILIGAAGAALGLLPWYYLGKWIGQDGVKSFADRHGRLLTLSAKDIEKADTWFDKHGKKAVLIARAIPAIRALIAIPAAISGMNVFVLVWYAFLGSLVWDGAFGALGYFIGERSSQLEMYVNIGMSVIIAIVIIWYIYRVITFKQEK